MRSIRWIASILAVFTVMTCYGCKTLDPDALARLPVDIEAAGTKEVFAGLDLEFAEITEGKEVALVVDSLKPYPVAVAGIVASKRIEDSVLTLIQIQPSKYPRTLSVAFRNVLHAYDPASAPTLYHDDPIRTLGWIFLGLPLFTIGGGLALGGIAGLVTGDFTNCGGGISGVCLPSGPVSIGFLIGFLSGLVAYVLITAGL